MQPARLPYTDVVASDVRRIKTPKERHEANELPPVSLSPSDGERDQGRGVPFIGRRTRCAFTLIELFVVISIITLLADLLLPALSSAQAKGRKTVCLSNLHQTGLAIIAYAADSDGKIPYGPKAPPFTSPNDFYPSTGAPTSLISLRTGPPVGLGLLLQQHLARQPKVLFCPGTDQPLDSELELSRVGTTQAQSSYYYRHAGVTALFDNQNTNPIPDHIVLDKLGNNRNDQPIRALVVDTQFLCPPDLESFNIKPRTNHRQKVVNILYWDGHSVSRSNRDNRFTVDLTNPADLQNGFDKILKALEQADVEM